MITDDKMAMGTGADQCRPDHPDGYEYDPKSTDSAAKQTRPSSLRLRRDLPDSRRHRGCNQTMEWKKFIEMPALASSYYAHWAGRNDSMYRRIRFIIKLKHTQGHVDSKG